MNYTRPPTKEKRAAIIAKCRAKRYPRPKRKEPGIVVDPDTAKLLEKALR